MDEKTYMLSTTVRTCLLSVGFCLLPFSISTAAVNVKHVGEIKQFIGIEGQHRQMPFAQPFGEELFKENYAQYNLYAGIRWSQHFGLAIGHENSNTRKRTKSFAAGSALLGEILANQETHEGSSEIKGNYIELLGFIPLDSLNMRFTEFYAGVGFIRNKLNLEDNLTVFAGVPVVDERHYDEHKNQPRAEIGIQKTIANHFGLRLSLSWEKTSTFRNLKPVENPNADSIVNLKNTWSTGAGFFWIF